MTATKLNAKMAESFEDKQKRLRELEERVRLREGLPHLFGWKWYAWARAFFESSNKINLLCAANQISKSSTQIRKAIHWATDQKLWPNLWRRNPKIFWYLYPTIAQATIEFETKWQEFMPREEFKNDPVYGWRAKYKHGDIHEIIFNSGVHLYFKTYSQKDDALQTATVDSIFADEEMPIPDFNEIIFRISASEGYFNMVFTATIGQDEWRRAMEPEDGEVEFLPSAFKQTVSMYDCVKYDDGTESHWTIEKIHRIEAACTSHNEILRRVHGRFIYDLDGRKYPPFSIKDHLKAPMKIPPDWLIYGAADPGGGQGSHLSAIVFIAVRPDFRAGRVFLSWRSDGVITTAGDVVTKFLAMEKAAAIRCTERFYDFASKDFQTIAGRMGEPFSMAKKGHELGEQVLNTLFKHSMLLLYDDPETNKLAVELSTLRKATAKNKAKDDLADALRYCATGIPWDFSQLTNGVPLGFEGQFERVLTPQEEEIKARRAAFEGTDDDRNQKELEEEFSEWNDAYGA